MGTIGFILGVIGNITSMVMFLSPMSTFWRIFKRKSTASFSAFPYVCTFLNCLLWFFYGLPMISSHNVLVLSINGAGIALEAIYLVAYLVFAPRRKKAVIILLTSGTLAFCAVIAAVTLTAFSRHDRATFVGSVCVVIGTMMYASPLSVMRLVITTRSVEYMPFLLSLCSLFNAILWTSYGSLKRDKFIIIPNGLGCLLGAAQLGLYAKYHNNETNSQAGTNSESYDLDAKDKTQECLQG